VRQLTPEPFAHELRNARLAGIQATFYRIARDEPGTLDATASEYARSLYRGHK
jgi:hypothetical protein